MKIQFKSCGNMIGRYLIQKAFLHMREAKLPVKIKANTESAMLIQSYLASALPVISMKCRMLHTACW